MNSRERAERALRRQGSDRVPVVPLIDTWYAAACYGVPVSDCFLKPEIHARALVSVVERHPGIDGFSINIGLTSSVIREMRETSSGYDVIAVDGTRWNVPRNDIGTPVSREIVDFNDERFLTADALRPHIVETLRLIPRDILRSYDVSAGLTAPFSQVLFMTGIEPAMIAMIERPDALKSAVETRIPFALRWAEELAELGAPSVWIGEGLGSSSLISPGHYAEFALPAERRVTERLRKLGVPSVIHICGDTNRSLDAIASCGADGFEIDWPVDLAAAKSRIGDRLSLKGNLHTSHLVESSPEEIYREAAEAIAKAGSNGGFILSSGCAIGRDTPPENIEAMVRAADDFGWYGGIEANA